MALSQSSLKGRIIAEIDSRFDIQDSQVLEDFADAVAKAIVDEIVSNAVVSSTGATGTGPFGGPLPITGLPGSVS